MSDYNKSEAKQKAFWAKEQNRRHPSHPVIEAFALPKVHLIENQLRGLNHGQFPPKMLDLGCGNGYFTHYFNKISTVTAVDYSPSMLEINPCGNKICADANQLPFKDQVFDMTFCANMFHHMTDHATVLAEIRRVTKKFFAVVEPNRNSLPMFLFGVLKSVERGSLRFSLRYLENIIQSAGLEIVYGKTTGGVLPNKTPKFLLNLMKMLEAKEMLHLYLLVISTYQTTGEQL